MNVFVVPSWYPSPTKPSYGIFVKEQLDMLAKLRPSWKIGVSTWGQGDENKLLWVRDHFKNLSKLKAHGEDVASQNTVENCSTYYQPALSWTKKLKKGNLGEIIRCNELNFQAYVLANGKPNVIWVQASYPGAMVGKYLSEKYKVPYVVHVRLGGFMFEYLLSQVGAMKNELLASINGADRLVVTSNFHRKELERHFKVAQVIHNPVDMDFFDCVNQDQIGSGILSIGRLEEEKGFDLLLEAISNIPDITLTLAGAGSLLDKLKKQATDLGIEERVVFPGEMSRTEVRKAMQDCSFYVLPSRYETFGNVLLEAMACGKPVLATNCGGPAEIVTPEAGLLSEINVENLTVHIRNMVERRNSFKSETIRKAMEHTFSPSVWADKVEELFTAVAAK